MSCCVQQRAFFINLLVQMFAKVFRLVQALDTCGAFELRVGLDLDVAEDGLGGYLQADCNFWQIDQLGDDALEARFIADAELHGGLGAVLKWKI